jgi:hypothetical protein
MEKTTMSKELDEAMDAIPDLTEDQITALIEFQIAELAAYTGKGTRVAKKDQSDEDVQSALDAILGEQPKAPPVIGFKRRF